MLFMGPGESSENWRVQHNFLPVLPFREPPNRHRLWNQGVWGVRPSYAKYINSETVEKHKTCASFWENKVLADPQSVSIIPHLPFSCQMSHQPQNRAVNSMQCWNPCNNWKSRSPVQANPQQTKNPTTKSPRKIPNTFSADTPAVDFSAAVIERGCIGCSECRGETACNWCQMKLKIEMTWGGTLNICKFNLAMG